MNSRLLAFCLTLLLAGPVFAQTETKPSFQHPETGLSFPASLGPLTYRSMMDYGKQGHPELGVSVNYYQAGTNTWSDIYLYDLGKKDLGTGLASPEVKKAFSEAIEDISEMEKRQIYKAVKKVEEGEAKLETPSGPLPVMRASFTYERLPGPKVSYTGPLVSELYLTAYKGYFLKIRFTSPADKKDLHQEALQKFLGDLGKILK